jgi:hypothetical protein
MMAEAPGKGLSVNKINKKMRNKILSIHAAWLFNNGYYDESIDCLNQAEKYSQDKRLKRTGVQIMPRAIPCTSSDDPERGSLGAFAPAGVRARKL